MKITDIICFEKEEIDAWKKFLDLLIPPKDYWKSKYSFDFGEPDNVSTNQDQTVQVIWNISRFTNNFNQ